MVYCREDIVKATDEDGKTLLMDTILADNWLFAEALVLHGADVLVQDNNNWTAFHHAVCCNRYRSLQVLTRASKDKNFWNNSEESPLDVALANENEKCVLLLTNEVYMGHKVLKKLREFTETNLGNVSISNYKSITHFSNFETNSESAQATTTNSLSTSQPTVSSSNVDIMPPELHLSDPEVRPLWTRGTDSLQKEDSKRNILSFKPRKRDRLKSSVKSKKANLLTRKRSSTSKDSQFSMNFASMLKNSGNYETSQLNNSNNNESQPKLEKKLSDKNRAKSYGESYFTKNVSKALKITEGTEENLSNVPSDVSDCDSIISDDVSEKVIENTEVTYESDNSYDESGHSDISESDEFLADIPLQRAPVPPPTICVSGYEFPTST